MASAIIASAPIASRCFHFILLSQI
jgi:hypothetical protein